MFRFAPSSIILALVLCLASATASPAHLGSLSYSQLRMEGSHILYRLRFAAHLIPGTGPAMEGKLVRTDIVRMEPRLLEWLANSVRIESGTTPCVPSIADTMGPDANDDLEVVLDFACRGPVDGMRLAFNAFDRQLPDYQNIVAVETGTRKFGFVLSQASPRLNIPAAHTDQAAGEPGSGFFTLGIGHILGGFDHLLFLLGLLLLGGTLSRLALVVTSFTLAHSITLALSALGLFRLPAEPVELVIALSIVWVGAERLGRTSHDRRLPLAFGFGLMHGFAFADLLGRSGLEQSEMLGPLLGFNLGVEAGQLLVIVPALVLLGLLRTRSRADMFERVLAWLLVAVGLAWATERAATLLA